MEYIDTIPTAFSGQRSMIKNQGEEFWETMCAGLPASGIFSKQDVADCLLLYHGFTVKTATLYASALVNNCVAMPEGGLVRVSPRRYRFWGPQDDCC